MLKRFVLLNTLLISSAAQADLNLTFDSMHDVKQISPAVKFANDISIKKIGENNVLRLHTGDKEDNNWIKIPTNLKQSTNYTFQFDWKSTNSGAGLIFRLSDHNHNRKALDMVLENGTFITTSYTGKKYKRRRLIKPLQKQWYRFTIEVKDDSYCLAVKKLANEQTPGDQVIYCSKEKKKGFKINKNITPRILMLAQWPGQGNLSFFYDNITITKNK